MFRCAVHIRLTFHGYPSFIGNFLFLFIDSCPPFNPFRAGQLSQLLPQPAPPGPALGPADHLGGAAGPALMLHPATGLRGLQPFTLEVYPDQLLIHQPLAGQGRFVAALKQAEQG